MFNKAIKELYNLKDKYKDNPDITESIDYILKNLILGMTTITDILTCKNNIKH